MLRIHNLTTEFPTRRGAVRAVEEMSLSLERGQIMGLVGESGCGKSVTLLSILRLVARPGRIISGSIHFEGRDILSMAPAEVRRIRGADIAMVFQDPLTTLNPVFRVGEQIRESLRVHRIGTGRTSRREERETVLSLMKEVGIPSPESRYWQYPHEFSGGMQQRALIAIALACRPKLLLADEPTTALDVTIQAQILELLSRINSERGTAILFVTHDLAVASEFCHWISVMYAGRIVEQGPVDEVIADPLHPYTEGLLRSIPRLVKPRRRLSPIPGDVPDLIGLTNRCSFESRCDRRMPECTERPVSLVDVGGGRHVRCILYE